MVTGARLPGCPPASDNFAQYFRCVTRPYRLMAVVAGAALLVTAAGCSAWFAGHVGVAP